MQNRLLLTLVCLLTALDSTAAERPAGIVLYSESANTVYLLLADHAHESAKSRGWAAYGGGPHDGESPAETAARETEEETRGFFQRSQLLEKISGQDPVIDTNGFALFFAKVDFVPAQQVTNSRPEGNDRAYTERGPYVWIPFSVIAKYLDDEIVRDRKYLVDERFLPETRNTNWFWWVWLRNLRTAIEADALPWQN